MKPTLLLLSLGLTMLSTSCRTQPPQALPPPRHAVILVPGFKGSTLVEKNSGDKIWLTAFNAIFGRKSLELPLPGQQASGALLTLESKEIFRSVTAIPLIWDVPVYQTAIDALENASVDKAKLFTFHFDWRKDLVSATLDLDQLLRSLKNEGFRKITIVAHSMGGLLTAYCLRYGTQPLEYADESWTGAELVDSVIFAATPFRGAPVILHDMQLGIVTGFNRTLLNAKAVSTLPAAYQLLPPDFANPLFTENRDIAAPRLHDAQNWHDYGWGLMKEDVATVEERQKFTEQMLAESNRFYHLIHTPFTNQPRNIPVVNIVGIGAPALAQTLFYTKAKELVFEAKYLPPELDNVSESDLVGDGDGTVPKTSAALPDSWRSIHGAEEAFVDSTHLETLVADSTIAALRRLIEG